MPPIRAVYRAEADRQRIRPGPAVVDVEGRDRDLFDQDGIGIGPTCALNP